MKNVLPDNILKCLSAEDRARLGKVGMTAEETLEAGKEKAEKQIQSEIAQYLRLHEIEFIWPDSRKKSHLPEGWPDFTFCYRGVACGVEAKTPSGTVEPHQILRHEQMRRNGWVVIIARSVADVKALFQEINIALYK
jgi:hypothetical protein